MDKKMAKVTKQIKVSLIRKVIVSLHGLGTSFVMAEVKEGLIPVLKLTFRVLHEVDLDVLEHSLEVVLMLCDQLFHH